MATRLQKAQDKYNYGNWDAQEKQAKDTFANNVQNLDQSVWNNAAATGNTRGSFNGYAYRAQLNPIQQGLDQTLGQIGRDKSLYNAEVKARNAASKPHPYTDPATGKVYPSYDAYLKAISKNLKDQQQNAADQNKNKTPSLTPVSI